ncbi:MAG: hypothetical protein QN720_01200 [Nitrososphaeraceae archaeon]|nr:hypothetical protein [Nitrososphaeraceae archaeon]
MTPATWDQRRQPSRDMELVAVAARAPRAGRQDAGSGMNPRKEPAAAVGRQPGCRRAPARESICQS